jgi:hypothetical protein
MGHGLTQMDTDFSFRLRFEGTFSGTLTCQIEGVPDTIVVTNGRFAGLEIPYDDEP